MNNFIKKTNLIIDDNDFFGKNFNKKQNQFELLNKQKLKYSLNEARDECKKLRR